MASLSEELGAVRDTRPATMAGLFRIPAFTRLWRAMLVSSLGDWTSFVAVTALVTRLGGERPGYAITGVMLARLLPSIIFGPFAGVLVDRFSRKRLMIIADIGRGIGYASMPLLGELWAIYALSFANECLSLLWLPSRDATIPNIVPRRQLGNANSVALFTVYGSLPLGGILFTALAGVSVGLGTRIPYFADHPESLPLWLDGLTFAFSAYMISGMDFRRSRRPAGKKLRPAEAWSDLTEGIRFLREHALQRAMTVGILMAFIGVGSVIAIGPIFAQRTLGAGQPGWGLLVAAVGLGMGVGMLSVNVLQRLFPKDVVFPLAMMGAGAALVVLAVMPNIGLAAAVTGVAGILAGMAWVSGYTLLHENVEDEFRGRTFATLTILVRFGMLASLAGFPALAQALGSHSFTLLGTELRLEGTRLALWLGAGAVFAGGFLSRRGLARHRRSRPRPLALRPSLHRGKRTGTFIVFEGVEGCGKSSQLRLAGSYLASRGHEILHTGEPGGTEVGTRLRRDVLDADRPMDARAEALVFAALRAQHVVSVIRPALESGKVVLSDRYVDSSLVYQGTGRGLGEHDVLTLSAWATEGLFPDLVILLHVEPEAALAEHGDEVDEEAAHRARLADAYLRIAEDHPERFVVVDAVGTAEEVHARVREALDGFLAVRDGDGGAASR